MFKPILILFLGALLSATSAIAEIKTANVPYKSADMEMEGFAVYDDSLRAPTPGILLVPDWMGMTNFPKEKAKELAKEGYIVFVADVYGKGNQPINTQEAAQLTHHYSDSRPLLQSHMRAAYDTLLLMKNVDPKKIAVIGYCFGGAGALELARTGAPLAGTAVFHGLVDNPNPKDTKNIRGAVLVMHGEKDPIVKMEAIDKFKKEMKEAGIPLEVIVYPKAEHGFTNPSADKLHINGVAYNPDADKKSWQDLQSFLKSIFK